MFPMDFLRDLSMIGDSSDNPSKIRDYVKQLEDELRKIDAFKRELPLCMLLVTHAIERLKEETLKGSKGNCDEDERAKLGKDDKKSWMSSVQLWSSNTDHHIETQHDSVVELNNKGSEEDNGISLGLPIASKLDSRNVCSEINVEAGGGLSMPFIQTKPNQHQQQQHIFPRKQRRSWSNELHRRFMNALQQLGGAQVATPKQIRELMHVDGLTNDEVKSHLQKYRLHIRKVPFSDATPNEFFTSVDQNGSHSKASNTQSRSPHGPLLMNESARGCDTMYVDEEDEKIEGPSWNHKFFMLINVL